MSWNFNNYFSLFFAAVQNVDLAQQKQQHPQQQQQQRIVSGCMVCSQNLQRSTEYHGVGPCCLCGAYMETRTRRSPTTQRHPSRRSTASRSSAVRNNQPCKYGTIVVAAAAAAAASAASSIPRRTSTTSTNSSSADSSCKVKNQK